MILLKWIAFLLIGKICIYIWMQFHLPKFVQKSEWFRKLHECDLCSGVWIFTVLSLSMGVDLLEVTGFGYIPLVGAIITGIVVSWLVHIFSLGWKAKYEVVVI